MNRLILAALVIASAGARADLTFVTAAVTQGKASEVTISLQGPRAAFEFKPADGPPRTMLRHGDAKRFYVVEHAKKEYLVIDELTAEQQSEMQQRLKAQMDAQLARMPPEQRARIEASMNAAIDPTPRKVTFTYEKKKVPARKVNGFACQDYVVRKDGEVHGEGCFADWKAVGLDAEEFKQLMKDALPTASMGLLPAMVESNDDAPGFPVHRVVFDKQGQVLTEATLKSVSKSKVPPARFELPKGYAEKQMPGAALRSPRAPGTP
jgi:hypothetical protein